MMRISLQDLGVHDGRPRAEGRSSTKAAGLRIAFLASHYPAGGAQEILANIAAGLQARGCDIRLIALYPVPGAETGPAGPLAWRCAVESKPRSPFAFINLLRGLARELSAFRPDAIISALPAANIASVAAGRLAAPQAKVVITHHSPVGTHNRIFNAIDSWLGRWRNVSAVVSVSESVSRSLETKRDVYCAKRHTIHNALPPEIERLLGNLAAERSRRGAFPREVVATGRLSAQKNYPALLRAAARLPDVRIVIIGSGEDEIALKQLASELGVDRRVEFLGRRTREETLRRLSESGVFVQPSLYEGHSLALVEAAKVNIPIVVSNVPEQIEGVTNAGGEICAGLVDPHDDAALAREIARLLDEPRFYAEAVARSGRLAETFQFDRMIAAYEQLIA
jgi:glycosyltransferase involved in cell wall biosynthesis